MKTIIEPFRIKSVEQITFTTREQREQILKEAFYNPFKIKAEDVIIDLLTDSGTSAMSSKQWGRLMEGDESYAGAKSFYRFESAVKDLTGYVNIIPTHQGRAAESILFKIFRDKGKITINNTHFDTTRANVTVNHLTAVDLPAHNNSELRFKGNIDCDGLVEKIKEVGSENVALIMITITNNAVGGLPVSMENIKQASSIAKKNNIPFFLDACRFAENAFFIKKYEKGFSERTVKSISQEMFSYADGCTMSAKKDALVNMGGFLALNDSNLAEEARNQLIITEGFPTYGGLNGRDLEAIAQGLNEIVDEDYLTYRIRSIEYVGERMLKIGIPIIQPIGGHAIFIDAQKLLSQIPRDQFPGQSLVCSFFLEGGIRSCEIGSVMFGKYNDELQEFIPAPYEYVRMAIPRRVYTQSHMDYVIEVSEEVYRKSKELRGYKIIKEPKLLRHFTAHFAPI
ncbi:MAG: tryptophanase [Ignavibacteria bacterium]|nr:tryptophanase [Ignavibacteria bacterium]